MTKPVKAKGSTTVHVRAKSRDVLETLAIETSFHCKRQITSSAFVHYLIHEFGEQAKQKLIAEIPTQN